MKILKWIKVHCLQISSMYYLSHKIDLIASMKYQTTCKFLSVALEGKFKHRVHLKITHSQNNWPNIKFSWSHLINNPERQVKNIKALRQMLMAGQGKGGVKMIEVLDVYTPILQNECKGCVSQTCTNKIPKI